MTEGNTGYSGEINCEKVDIVTVHGTFAGDPADDGEKWWQRGSDFLTKLQSCVQERLEIHPFHWSGENSERDRRSAGDELEKEIAAFEKPPLVIGHSHGGSVGIHALAQFVMKRGTNAREGVRGFLTVGTPMILFNSNRNPFTRFNIYGRIMLLVALSVGIIYTLETLALLVAPGAGMSLVESLGFFFRAPQPWVVLATVVLLYWYGRRNGLRQKLFRQGTLKSVFSGRFNALSHTQDEAIRALSRGKNLNPKVVGFGTIFGGLFSLFAFGLIFLEFGSQMSTVVLSDRHFYSEPLSNGQRLPKLIHNGDRSVPLALASADRTNPVYNAVKAGDIRLTESWEALLSSEIWQHSAVRQLLEQPEASWLAGFRDVPPADNGVIFHRVGADYGELGENFARYLEQLVPHGPGSDYPLTRAVQGDALTPPTFDEIFANFGFIFAAAMNYAPAEGYDVRQLETGDWIIWFGPWQDLATINDAGILKLEALERNTRFRVPQPDMVKFDETCSVAAADRPIYFPNITLCEDFYSGTNFFYRNILNFSDYKFKYLKENVPYSWMRVVGLQEHGDNAPNWLRGTPQWETLNRSMRFSGAITMALVMFSTMLALAVAFVLTPIFQGVLTGALKSTAYGNDGFGEYLKDVRPSLDFADDTIGTIPQMIEEEMLANSRIDAPEALERIRALLAQADLSSLGGADPLGVAMKFDKSELIHNAYFHSDLFIKYIALLLIENYGLTPTEAFTDDLDYDALRAEM